MTSASMKGSCWNCSARLEGVDYGRQDSCETCGRDTHVCRNCRHYDPAYNNQCRETQADRVVDKERSNFCDYFSPVDPQGRFADFEKEAAARSAAEALFGGGGAKSSPSSSSSANDARAAAEALFKKKN